MTTSTYSALALLAVVVRADGPVETARVSSAQARGRAKRYSYWGAVRYQIRFVRGRLSNVAQGRATSDRRSYERAEADLDALCEREDRIPLAAIGGLDETDANCVLLALVARGDLTIVSMMTRIRTSLPPHWLDRAAAGRLSIASVLLTEADHAALLARSRDIVQLRATRAARCERSAWPPPSGQAIRRYHGLPVTLHWDRRRPRGQRIWYRYATYSGASLRAVVREYLRHRIRRVGPYYFSRGAWQLKYDNASWQLKYNDWSCVAFWPQRPHRSQIAQAIRQHRAGLPGQHPDTLGWRAWLWDGTQLRSPHQDTVWPHATLSAEAWSTESAVRGVAGIHARRLPRDWRRADWRQDERSEGPSATAGLITGVVERQGRYVLGTTGWRAEQATIRALLAPDLHTLYALTSAYPDVTIYLRGEEDAHAHR